MSGATAKCVAGCWQSGADGAPDSEDLLQGFWCEESFRDQKQEFCLEGVRVKQGARLETLLLVLTIPILMLAVIGRRSNKLACAEKFKLKKKPRKKQRKYWPSV